MYEEKPKRNFVGNGKAVTGKYGVFYNLSLNVNKLKEIADEKGYCRVTMSENKEPDKYGNTFAIVENSWKPKEETPKRDYGESTRPDIASVPF